jgi:hypothetical protein
MVFVSVSNDYARVAQSVEQRTENPCVAGSIPASGIIYMASSPCGEDRGIYRDVSKKLRCAGVPPAIRKPEY